MLLLGSYKTIVVVQRKIVFASIEGATDHTPSYIPGFL